MLRQWHTHVRDGLSPAPLGVAVESVQQRGQCDPQDGRLDEGGVGKEDAACTTASSNCRFTQASHTYATERNSVLRMLLHSQAMHAHATERTMTRETSRVLSCRLPVKNSKMNRHQQTLSKTCIAGGVAISSRTTCRSMCKQMGIFTKQAFQQMEKHGQPSHKQRIGAGQGMCFT